MNFLKTIALSTTALVLFSGAARAGTGYDTPYATPSAINCTSDGSCALLKFVRVQAVTYGALIGSAFYTWQPTCGGTPDAAFYIRPSGVSSGCFKMDGFAPLDVVANWLTPAQYPFNAHCDGTWDDTAALTALKVAAGSTRQIFVPKGPGLCVTSGLTLDVANQAWTFAPGAGLLKKPSSLGDLVTISANGVSIFGGVFDGNQAYAPPTSTVTISNASPGVIGWAAHGLPAGTVVIFTVAGGTLPTGITSGAIYYVIAAGLATNSFEISASSGGAAINTSSAGSGVFTGTALPGRGIIGGGTGIIIDGATVRNTVNDAIALYGSTQPILRHLNLSNAGLDGSYCATVGTCALLRVYGDGISADALGPIIEDVVGDQSMHAAAAHINGVSVRGQSSCSGYYYYGAKINGIILKFNPSITSTLANEDFDNFCIRDSNISNVRTYGGGEGVAVGRIRNDNYVNLYIEATNSEPLEFNTGTGNIFTNTQIKSSCPGLTSGACGLWLDGSSAASDAKNTFAGLNIEAVVPFHGALIRAQNADDLIIDGGNLKAVAGSDAGGVVINLQHTHGASISNVALDGGGYVEGAFSASDSDHVTSSSVTFKNATSYGVGIAGTAAWGSIPVDNYTFSSPVFISVGNPINAPSLSGGALAGPNIRTTGCVGCNLNVTIATIPANVERLDWRNLLNRSADMSGTGDPTAGATAISGTGADSAFDRRDGGPSTSRYVQTGASTWTANGAIYPVASIVTGTNSITGGDWSAYDILQVADYSVVGSGGGGTFKKLASCTDDHGTCFHDTASNPFQRQFAGPTYSKMFGALDGSSANAAANQAAIGYQLAWLAASSSAPRKGVIDCGTFHHNAAWEIPYSQGGSLLGQVLGCTTLVQDTANTPQFLLDINNTWGWEIGQFQSTWNNQAISTDTASCAVRFDTDNANLFLEKIHDIHSSKGWGSICINYAHSPIVWDNHYSHIVHGSNMVGPVYDFRTAVTQGASTNLIEFTDARLDNLASGLCGAYFQGNAQTTVNQLDIGDLTQPCGVSMLSSYIVGDVWKIGESAAITLTASNMSFVHADTGSLRLGVLSLGSTALSGGAYKAYGISGDADFDIGTLSAGGVATSGGVTFYANRASGNVVFGSVGGIVGVADHYLTDVVSSASANTTQVTSWQAPIMCPDSGDANVTWTVGSSCPILRFDTTLTANRTVTIADNASGSASNLYNGLGPTIIRNAATPGAFTLTLKNSATTTIDSLGQNTNGVMHGCFYRFGMERCDSRQGLLPLSGGTLTGALDIVVPGASSMQFCGTDTTSGKRMCFGSGFPGVADAGASIYNVTDGKVLAYWPNDGTAFRLPQYTTSGALVLNGTGGIVSAVPGATITCASGHPPLTITVDRGVVTAVTCP